MSATFETIDPVSGEYARRALRPMITPEPMSQLPAPKSQLTINLPAPPTAVSRSLRSPRWPWVLGAMAIAVILASVVGLSLTTDAKPPPTMGPAADAPSLVKPTPPPPPAVDPPIVEPRVDPPIVAATIAPPVVVTPPVVLPPVVTPKGKAPPTAGELKKRVAGLEAALQKATAPGEDPDPSALTLLRKYKVEATMVDTIDDRQRLAESLKAFEQTFLLR